MPPTSSLTPPSAGTKTVEWVEAVPYLNLSQGACESIHTDFDPADMQRRLFEIVGRLNAQPMADVYAKAMAGSTDDMLELAIRHAFLEYPAKRMILILEQIHYGRDDSPAISRGHPRSYHSHQSDVCLSPCSWPRLLNPRAHPPRNEQRRWRLQHRLRLPRGPSRRHRGIAWLRLAHSHQSG